MSDNRNQNIYNRREQLAFAMGVFETKVKYDIENEREAFKEFIERVYEMGEYNLHHKAWIDTLNYELVKKENRNKDIDYYEEYENACEKFRQIEAFIERGCVAL